MCNRIQGRTPVYGTCLVLVFRCVLDAAAVCYRSSVWCLWCEPKWTCSEVERCWMLSTICCWISILFFFGLWFGFSLSFVVSEIDHCLLRSIRFLRWICVLCWHCFGSIGGFVSAVDLAGVVVGTFSCWSDFSMRASVKHELLGHGFHDELFN